jgi:cytochrome c-type biogenesis protein CcmH/NrfG
MQAREWWQLSLLRMAVFCEGRPNVEYVMGVGCRVMEGREDIIDGSTASRTSWKYVSVDIIAVFAVLTILYYTCTVNQQVGAMLRALTQFVQRYAPPLQQQTEQQPIVLQVNEPLEFPR